MEQFGSRREEIRKWRSMTQILCYTVLLLPIITLPYLVKDEETIRAPPLSKKFLGEQSAKDSFDTEYPSTILSSAMKDPSVRRNFSGRRTMDSSKGFISASHLTSRGQESLPLKKLPGQKQIRKALGAPRIVSSAPNELPELLMRLRPQVLKDVPRNYSSEYKNPCYYTQDGNIHCLPYFFLAGMPKSGTTDMFKKISLHPHIVEHTKENHWWIRESNSGVGKNSLQRYADKTFTKDFMECIEEGGDPKRIIIGDGSPSTFWDDSNWKRLYPEYKSSEPPYTVADFVYTLLPNSKHLVTFRDPTKRLYSDFNYFKHVGGKSKTPEQFHERVLHSISMFSACLKYKSLRGCTYESMVNFTYGSKDHVRLWIGVYNVFTKDWIARFPPEQFMAIQLEEWALNCTHILSEIFKFLDVGDLPLQICKTETCRPLVRAYVYSFDRALNSDIEYRNPIVSGGGQSSYTVTRGRTDLPPDDISKICLERNLNVQSTTDFKPMLNSTKQLLRDFHRPYVKELANLLQDDKFLWDY